MRRRHLLALAVLFVPAVALARAGGGSHYSGGFSAGGYSGGGSSGGSGLVYLLIELAIDYPQVGIPLLVVCAVGWVVMANMQQSQTDRFHGALDDLGPEPSRPADAIVATLRTQDPGFDADAFRAKAKKIFLAVQEAWFARNLDLARAFMSDGVLRRFTSQQALMAKEGVRNAIADVAVLDLDLLDVTTTAFFHVLEVRIDARMRDCDVSVELSDEQARGRAARAALERFTEVWTFVRRPGATTRPGYELSEGRCPNCGAAFPGGPSAQCSFCKAVVNSGHYDWVLCEITQSSERQVKHPAVDCGAMLEKDPGFDPFAVEDRASVVFWRMLRARATAEPALLDAVCTEPMRDQLRSEIADRRAQGSRLSYHEAAVGSAALLALEVGDEVDRAHVAIRWSARVSQAGLDQPAPPDAHTSAHATVFTLERRADAKTPPNRGLATERCGNCGAAQSDENAVKCAFCGTVLGASRSDWVLADKRSIEQWRAARRGANAPPPRTVHAFRSPTERARMLQQLAALAWADGAMTRDEEKLIESVGKRWNVPATTVNQLLGTRNVIEGPGLQPGTADAREFMQMLVEVACVDGRVDRLERRMLERAGAELRIDLATLDFSSVNAHRPES